MVYKWIFPILLIKNVCCTNNEHHKQTKSSSTLKTSRFNILSGTYEDQNSPENYFPDIEYPSDILDVAKPYYFKATDDAVLEPFPREVKDSFKFISTGGKYVEEPVVRHIEVIKPAILKTSSSLLKNGVPKDKTVTMNKRNTTSDLVENKEKDNVTYFKENKDSNINSASKLKNLTSPKNSSTDIFDSQEFFYSTDESFTNKTLFTTNATSNPEDLRYQEDETNVTSEEFI